MNTCITMPDLQLNPAFLNELKKSLPLMKVSSWQHDLIRDSSKILVVQCAAYAQGFLPIF